MPVLISISHIPLVLKSSIGDTVWLDHSMVLIFLRNHLLKSKLSHWRLNESILSDPIRVQDLGKALKEYFLLNDLEEISAETLWAAHKAMMGGQFIQIATQLRKERQLIIQKLGKEYSSLCALHKKDPLKVSISQLDVSRLPLNLALTVKAEKSIRWGEVKFYQQRDNIGPMPASMMPFTLPRIKMQDSSLTLNTLRIMHSF